MWLNEEKEHYSRNCSASLPEENLVFEALLKNATFPDFAATFLPAYATFVQSAQIYSYSLKYDSLIMVVRWDAEHIF